MSKKHRKTNIYLMIWAIMEKLIELLNEYDKEEWLWNKWEEDEQGLNNMWKIYDYHSKLKIISKEYWFIEWLVENDKIDFDNLLISEQTCWTDLFYSFSKYEVLLMILSISDSPVEFLCEILR